MSTDTKAWMVFWAILVAYIFTAWQDARADSWMDRSQAYQYLQNEIHLQTQRDLNRETRGGNEDYNYVVEQNMQGQQQYQNMIRQDLINNMNMNMNNHHHRGY